MVLTKRQVHDLFLKENCKGCKGITSDVKALAASHEELRGLLVKLERATNCWCDNAVGSPLVRTHTWLCRDIQKRLWDDKSG